MIYLVGGAPRTGKTTLAEAMAKKRSIAYCSLDHTTSAIVPYISEREFQTKLPLRIARQETNYSNDIFYTRYTSEEITDFYLHQAETFWPGILNLIQYAIQDEQDLVLEGWQILPHFLHSITSSEDQTKLRIIFLYKTNVKNIIASIKSTTVNNDWAMKNSRRESTLEAIAKMVGFFSDYIKREANKYGFQTVNTDADFQQIINELVESL